MVVLVKEGAADMAAVPGQGVELSVLEGQQVRGPEGTCEGDQVLVVDEGREEDVEAVQAQRVEV